MDNIYVDLVFISTQPICLVVGAFTPFAFKGMIDRCDPITVFSLFGFIFCRSFPSLYFPSREIPFAFVVKLVWWC